MSDLVVRGHFVTEPSAEEMRSQLRMCAERNRQLEKELADSRTVIEGLQAQLKQNQKGKSALKTLLAPYRKAILQIWDELPEEVEVAGPSAGLWQDRIAKSRSTHAKVLQTLLDGGGEMSLQQIRMTTKMGGNTSTYLSELLAKNWVQKTGAGMWALKG
jgi:hypothetical protein